MVAILACRSHSWTLAISASCSRAVVEAGSAQCLGADFEAARQSITAHKFVDGVRIDGVIQPSGAVVADWPEQRALRVGGLAAVVEVVVEQCLRAGVQGYVSSLKRNFAAKFDLYLESGDL